MRQKPAINVIKLMPDYFCWPLWWAGDHGPGNIDPATLPLQASTAARLDSWAETFDAILNQDDPAESGFPSRDAENAFEQEGRALWRLLQAELGPAYVVVYHSVQQGKVLTSLKELEDE